MTYIGRFAPSPTGDLHLGTLTAAVASYLHARQAGGQWLVRIEDIDPPREVAGSAASILATLDELGLHWDQDVLYQSTRLQRYREVAQELLDRDEAFYCTCSRQQIRELTGAARYPGTCRARRLPSRDAALRLRVPDAPVEYRDRLRGPLSHDIAGIEGDFVILRRDGLPAYHLAVVVDDAFQHVSDIVRGADLVASTPLHICLQERLGFHSPDYWHIPVITTPEGDKLSKGQGAPPVTAMAPAHAAVSALRLLGAKLPAELDGAPPGELWLWGIEHWRIGDLAGTTEVIAPTE